MDLLPINTVVTFGKRRGHIVGHTVFKRYSNAETFQTYYVVELDHESMGYMEPREGEINHDCFVSLILVHVGGLNGDGDDIFLEESEVHNAKSQTSS